MRTDADRARERAYYARNRDAVLARKKAAKAARREKYLIENADEIERLRFEADKRKRQLRREERKRRLARMKVERPERYRALMRRRDAKRRVSAARREYERWYRRENAGRRAEIRRERYADDPQYRLRDLLRSRLRGALAGRDKAGSAVELLGCSVPEAVRHIERQFHDGMTWENRGVKWHLDHIRPLAGFDLTDPAQLAQACHFTNLRPLAAVANIAKGDRVEFLI